MILMLAPAPNMAFGAMPSGASYVSDPFALVKIANDSSADQVALLTAGCFTLTPFGGWGNFGFVTLADLYAADTGALLPGVTGFPQHTIASVFSDPTASNDGSWTKTGTGTGAGNWTLVSNTSLADLFASIEALSLEVQGLQSSVHLAADGPVAAATTAALPANTYANGAAGVGATLTANANGALAAQDGETLSVGSRLLVKNEAAAANNGVYVVTQAGGSGAPYILTRAADADTPALLGGISVLVVTGAVNAGLLFVLAYPADELLIGASALSFYSTLIAYAGTLAAYDTVADLQSATVWPTTATVTLAGYHTAGDGGAGVYVRASGGAGAGKIQSADGQWWKLTGGTIRPKQFGCVGDGSTDDTTPMQTAATFAIAAYPTELDMTGTFAISKLSLTGGPGIVLTGNSELIGNATSATTALVDISMSGVSGKGQIRADCGYNTDYARGCWIHGTSSIQCEYIDLAIIIDRAQIGIECGDINYPSAIVGECTISGGTYGCLISTKVTGVETYVSFVGGQWSGDSFGGSGGWLTAPLRGCLVVGGHATFTGCQLIQTASVTNPLVEIQPLAGTGGEGTLWGQFLAVNCETEAAGGLAITANPSSLTISSTYGVRGLISFENCTGYISMSGSTNAVIQALQFDGNVDTRSNSYWTSPTRTHPNIYCDSALTDVYTDRISWDPKQGWLDYQAGVSGGVLHFEDAKIVSYNGLAPGGTGQSFPAATATVLLYQNAENAGLPGSFNSWYNPATGILTIGAGGVSELEILASAYAAGVTADLIIQSNGGSGWADEAYGNFSSFGQVSKILGAAVAGAEYRVVLTTLAGTSGSANLNNAVNFLQVKARR